MSKDRTSWGMVYLSLAAANMGIAGLYESNGQRGYAVAWSFTALANLAGSLFEFWRSRR